MVILMFSQGFPAAPGDPREGHGGARTAQGHGRAEADLSHSRLGVESEA